MRAVIQIVLGGLFIDRQGPGELHGGRDQFQRRLKIFFDIGPKMQPAAACECPFDVSQKCFIQDAPLLMPRFPPGIGEIDMDGCERSGGNPFAENAKRVAANDFAVGDLPSGKAGRLGLRGSSSNFRRCMRYLLRYKNPIHRSSSAARASQR